MSACPANTPGERALSTTLPLSPTISPVSGDGDGELETNPSVGDRPAVVVATNSGGRTRATTAGTCAVTSARAAAGRAADTTAAASNARLASRAQARVSLARMSAQPPSIPNPQVARRRADRN
jgi:hypothetical protein